MTGGPGRWVWKSDGAGATDFEGAKGAFSDSFKRAAVHWGIGRYLYDLDAPWVAIEQRGKSSVIKSSELATLRGVLEGRGQVGDHGGPKTQTSRRKGAPGGKNPDWVGDFTKTDIMTELGAEIARAHECQTEEEFLALREEYRAVEDACKLNMPEMWDFDQPGTDVKGYKQQLKAARDKIRARQEEQTQTILSAG